MASLIFTDAIGTVTLTNGLDTIAGGVGSRFAGWVPFQRSVGATATSLGTGARTQFRFRVDYGASFQMTEIPNTTLPQVLRLQAHLEGGGTVRVVTDDVAGRVYATCCLAPDAEVGLELTDRAELLYTLSLSLINLGSQTPMLCEYSAVAGPRAVLFGWHVSQGVTGGTFTRSDASPRATFQTLA